MLVASYAVTGHLREPYLTKCTNIVNRKNLSRRRLSCHKLQIESGRYCSGVGRALTILEIFHAGICPTFEIAILRLFPSQ